MVIMVTNSIVTEGACVCLSILTQFFNISTCFSPLLPYPMGRKRWEWDDLSILSIPECPPWDVIHANIGAQCCPWARGPTKR